MRTILLAFVALSLAYNDKVLLKDIQVLTFNKDAMTTGRRSPATEQMTCTNIPNYRNLVNSIQCRNVGFDGRDVNWKCEATVNKCWSLGKTVVSCEGYDYPDDPYVLAGSCGIEFSLVRSQNQINHSVPSASNTSVFVVVTLCLIFGTFLFFCLQTPDRSSRQRVATTTTTTSNSDPYTTPPNPTAPPYNEQPTTYSQPHTQHTVTTHVEHHYQPAPVQPTIFNDYNTGYVMGSLNEASRRPIITQQVQPIIVQPFQPYPVTVQPVQQYTVQPVQQYPIETNTETSTSFATTKRR